MTRTDATAKALRTLIERDDLPPSGRLPAERELAATLGVSRALLRAALATLEAEGRIWRHVGKGTFAGGRPLPARDRLAVVRGMASPTEVMESRLAIEPHAAALAALRASEDDLAHLRHCLGKLDAASNHANYARWDSTFHRAIVECARNTLLLALFDSVNAVRNSSGWARVWQGSIDVPRRSASQKHHQAIVQAIAQRKPEAAYDTMRVHIRAVQRWVFEGDGFEPTFTR